MRSHTYAIRFTRRRFVVLWSAGTAFPNWVNAFGSDFWNKKNPAEWSSAEVEQLLTKSPWAKQVTAEVPVGGRGRSGMGEIPRPANARYGDLTGPGEPGQVSGRASDLSSNKSENTGANQGPLRTPARHFKGIVRWESAKPVLDATKAALADSFANHYVLSFSGFPLGDSVSVSGSPKFSDSSMKQIRTASTLTLKGNHMATARVAQVVGDAVRIGFPKESMQLSKDDGEVAFTTIINRSAIRTRFILKEMMYRGMLAI